MPSRWAWQNYTLLGTASVEASSAAVTRPARWLRDQLRSKTWRSKPGWNTVPGWNDELLLTEEISGDALVTIAPGNYPTGADYAAAIEAALNAAATDNTYAVTYNAATHKLVYTRATGTAAFGIKWASYGGTAHAAKDMGFSEAADDTGETTYEGDLAVYHSREWIRYDLGGAQEVKLGILLEHNLSDSAVVKLQGATTAAGSLTAPATTQLLEVLGDDVAYSFFAGETYRHWTVVIEDQGNEVDGFSEAGLVYIGSYLQPSRAPTLGLELGREELSTVVISDSGAHFHDEKDTRRTRPIAYEAIAESERPAFEAMAGYVKTGRNLFLWLETEELPEQMLYGRLPQGVRITHRPARHLRWDVEIPFAEAL
jgi:hypothetical protein